MPSKTDGDGTQQDPVRDRDVTPTRRMSSRLLARAESTEKKPEQTPVKTPSLRRSRSQSITRSAKKGKEDNETKATLDIVQEVKEELEDEKSQDEPSQVVQSSSRRVGRPRKVITDAESQDERRANTPTRILPSRAAAKSPSRKAVEDVAATPRLTRRARQLGFKTPDQEKEAKLTIVKNPTPRKSPETGKAAAEEKEVDQIKEESPSGEKEHDQVPRTGIENFMNNWSDVLHESTVEEPMDVSAAEFVEVELRDGQRDVEEKVETVQLCEVKTLDVAFKVEEPQEDAPCLEVSTEQEAAESVENVAGNTLPIAPVVPEEQKNAQLVESATEALTEEKPQIFEEPVLVVSDKAAEETFVEKAEKREKKKTRKSLDEVEPVAQPEPEEISVEQEEKKKKKKKKREIVESVLTSVENLDKAKKDLKDTEKEGDNGEQDVQRKKKKKKKAMVVMDEVDDVEMTSKSNKPTKITLKRMFNEPKQCSEELTGFLQELYTWSNQIQRRVDDLPDAFLNNDSETIWQFVAHKNRQINKDWRKYSWLLDEPIAVDGLSDLQDDVTDEQAEDEDVSEMEENEGMEDEAMDDEDVEELEENVDLFDLNDEDLKDLEREMNEERDFGEGTSEGKENERPRKKYPKSIVDDKFFSKAEMEAFCDEAEKQNDEGGILDTVDDSWGGPANYRYEDFFGKLDDVVHDDDSAAKKTKKRKVEPDASRVVKKKKSVRFAIDEDEGEEHEERSENNETASSQPVLLGQSKEKEQETESKLKADIRKLKESIRKLEEENLAPRSWELSGEVTGQQRGENELLETHVQFDNTAKRAPEVTEDFTEKLEAMIKQRIKDQAFDDVVRIKKVDEKVDVYRNEAIEEQELMKKSLAEVYEKEYQKAAGQVEAVATENPVHKAIEEKMNKLFLLIDAMSHFEYTPPPVRPEVKIVSNMAALRVEEVGMQASTDAQLLAPEEMKKKQKGELKADEERSKTDKLRQRRKKKTKQRAMIVRVGAETALAGQIEKKIKKKKVSKAADKEENLKSSNFFSKLQDTVQKEIKEKTTKKKKKVKSEKVATGGSKFKL